MQPGGEMELLGSWGALCLGCGDLRFLCQAVPAWGALAMLSSGQGPRQEGATEEGAMADLGYAAAFALTSSHFCVNPDEISTLC